MRTIGLIFLTAGWLLAPIDQPAVKDTLPGVGTFVYASAQ